MRMRLIIIWPVWIYIIFLRYLRRYDFRFKKVTEHEICVFMASTTRLEYFSFLELGEI
jgi:hypothetical protein